ncbi:peptidoglycan-binding domain-containing protein [Actibacterium pelagium]|uniref:Peptidoglycan binding-like domain-containing protein n=1 Tax=Actibacterium pelagium TaxID=2029103 RepID=A0A917EL60_9RHOB|nr:peptidoglycan-binding domain-containing protein [Actibacterium pelagium]GGE50793.1 hypothetical protein GCM10011517_18180 [Actibacterium pelagium]
MPFFAALNLIRQFAPATKLALQVLLLASAFLLSPAQTVQAQDNGTAQTEQALKLDREFRAELQLRLQLLGFDPKGTDGFFGPNSRKAISAWQVSIDAEPTGYFSVGLMDKLILQSQPAFDAWSLENPEGDILKY